MLIISLDMPSVCRSCVNTRLMRFLQLLVPAIARTVSFSDARKMLSSVSIALTLVNKYSKISIIRTATYFVRTSINRTLTQNFDVIVECYSVANACKFVSCGSTL